MSRLLWLLEYPTVNGGEHSLVATIPWVRAAGFDVAALVPTPSAASSLLVAAGVRVVPALADVTSNGLRLTLSERRARLVELLQAETPEIVVANSLSMARLAGPVTSELGLPAGGHVRDIVGLSSAAVADVNRLDRLWAVSQATRDAHQAQGVDAEKLRVLYNGIDTSQFQPRPRTGRLVAELGLPSDARIIAMIGQLVQRKGVDLTLEAFIAAAGDLPDWHLVIVGERYSQKAEARHFEAALHQRCDRSAVPERIHFLGRRDDVGELLPEIDLLVHSARQEPLGRVLLEAAACGLPVVASDVGGTREVFAVADSVECSVVGPLACELVSADDVAALATAICRLAGDAPLREHLGRVARRLALSRFEIRVRGPAIAAAYRELLISAGAVEKSPSICYNNQR